MRVYHDGNRVQHALFHLFWTVEKHDGPHGAKGIVIRKRRWWAWL